MKVIHAVVFVLLAALPCSVLASPEGVEEFLRESVAWLPSDPLIVVHEATRDAAGINIAGLDPVSGAWFMVNAHFASGRDPDGYRYFLKREDASPSDPMDDGRPCMVGFLLPVSLIYSMHELPESILDAEKLESGWQVRFEVTEDARSSPPRKGVHVANYDLGGRLQWHKREHPTQEIRWDYSQEDDRIERRIPQKGPAHFKVSFEQDVSVDDFEFSAVQARIKPTYIAEQQRLAALAAGYSDDGPGEWTPPSPEDQPLVPYDTGPVARWRLPLILGGGILVAIAVGEAIRRRRIQ